MIRAVTARHFLQHWPKASWGSAISLHRTVRVRAVHVESWLGGREGCSQNAIADHTALVFNIRGAANARSVLAGGFL